MFLHLRTARGEPHDVLAAVLGHRVTIEETVTTEDSVVATESGDARHEVTELALP
jgi:hypothetical protein